MKINIDIKNKVQAKLIEQRSEGMFMGQMIPRDEWIAAVTDLIYRDRELVLQQFNKEVGNILQMKKTMCIYTIKVVPDWTLHKDVYICNIILEVELL